LFTFLKISVNLQTALAAETHLAEQHWLEEQLNVVKLRMFSVATRMSSVWRREGKILCRYKPSLEINNNNSNQLFIIYAPSQQLQGQIQTHQSGDTSNYIMDKHNIKPKTK
jgi:hypothetical protein